MLTTRVGHPLLGVSGDWEVLARGPGVVTRIQPAIGRVTRTEHPALRSSGPVSFVVSADRAFVRPLDSVPAYVVPDGKPAHQTADAVGHGGRMLPGPDPGLVWVERGRNDATTLALVDLTSMTTRATVDLPQDTFILGSDNAGRVLVEGVSGTYVAGRAGLDRVTTGQVLATGPTRLLLRECDDQHRCGLAVLDRDSGQRRELEPPPGQTPRPRLLPAVGRSALGTISPDGSVAAIAGTDQRLHLVYLASGRHRSLEVQVGSAAYGGALAWSPDSEWLFVAADDGRLLAVDRATGSARTLDVDLPDIAQVAVRAARG